MAVVQRRGGRMHVSSRAQDKVTLYELNLATRHPSHLGAAAHAVEYLATRILFQQVPCRYSKRRVSTCLLHLPVIPWRASQARIFVGK
jgi:hypothetical protein